MSRAEEPLQVLDGADIARVLSLYTGALRSHQDELNKLNVFPVPDGDTGTNMLRTLESVEAELAGLESGDALSLPALCDAVAHASLMGARGNSGVILSQVLRAISLSLRECPAITAPEVTQAIRDAAAAARSAVNRPVEGTILTVADGAATAAAAALSAGGDLASVASEASRGAREALARTPELLPVLASAGVVDAGGAGLTLLYEALAAVTNRTEMPERLSLPDDVAERLSDAPEIRPVELSELASLRYEVMFLLTAPDDAVPGFKDAWGKVGDSIVVVGGDGIFNCHIHTDDIGAAIEAAVEIGTPRSIRVTDLLEQSGILEGPGAGGEGPAPAPMGSDRVPPLTAVVAVGNGAGVERIFRSLGVAQVVAGGQSMNPSTAEILEGISAAVGRDAIVLPNNKNIVAVAEQAARLADRTVVVVPTHSVPEAMAALIAYDPAANAEENSAAMSAAAARVTAGEVTRAVRDSTWRAGEVRAGDWIGVSNNGIEAVGDSLERTTCGLIDALVAGHHEIVTLVVGEGADPNEVAAVTQWLTEAHAGLAVEVHEGGQPLYPLLVSLE